jgi:hypothetical protein
MPCPIIANADPATGYYMMSGGKFSVVGGTSAAAPVWAALIARLNAALGARIGNFNELLYSQYGPNGVLRDITVGNNDTHGRLGGRLPRSRLGRLHRLGRAGRNEDTFRHGAARGFGLKVGKRNAEAQPAGNACRNLPTSRKQIQTEGR